MNNENLIPLNRRPIEQAREIQRQGGRASVEARRRRKELKQLLQMLIDEDAKRALKNKEQSRQGDSVSNREGAKSELRKTKEQKRAVREFAKSVTDVIERMTPHPQNSADYLKGFDMARACALELIRVCAKERTK